MSEGTSLLRSHTGEALAPILAKDPYGDRQPYDPHAVIEVRETDLLSQTAAGQLSIVLLDADLPNSMQVVDRLLGRLKNYSFPTPLAIEVGAACCPTHGADPDTLRAAAAGRPVQRGGNRGNASNAQ